MTRNAKGEGFVGRFWQLGSIWANILRVLKKLADGDHRARDLRTVYQTVASGTAATIATITAGKRGYVVFMDIIVTGNTDDCTIRENATTTKKVIPATGRADANRHHVLGDGKKPIMRLLPGVWDIATGTTDTAYITATYYEDT